MVLNLSLPKKSLIKPVIAAAVVILLISGIAIFILPQYIYISPFSKFYAFGVVDHKSIGQSFGANGNPETSYTISVILLDNDPVNHVSGGNALAYIVSKLEWDMIAPQDGIKIELLPSAHAKVVDLGPNPGSTPQWRLLPSPILPLNFTLTPNKNQYRIGENANFTIHLINDPTLSDNGPTNVSLALFKDCIYYGFVNGKLLSTNDNILNYDDSTEIQNVNLQPNQEVDYSFTLNFTNNQPATYFIRAYIGYYPPLQAQPLLLIQTISVNVGK